MALSLGLHLQIAAFAFFKALLLILRLGLWHTKEDNIRGTRELTGVCTVLHCPWRELRISAKGLRWQTLASCYISQSMWRPKPRPTLVMDCGVRKCVGANHHERKRDCPAPGNKCPKGRKGHYLDCRLEKGLRPYIRSNSTTR